MGTNRSFGERLFGALKLDATVYEEVEHDTSAFGQAAAVVALASIAQGIGAFQQAGVVGSLVNLVFNFVGWFISTGLVWLIGVKILNHTSDYPELLRTLGFASAPGLLAVIGVIPAPSLNVIVGLAVLVLSLVAWVIAARQALDVGTGRAVVVCFVALLIPWAISLFLVALVVGAGMSTHPAAVPGGMGF
jgi:hypothetical protein